MSIRIERLTDSVTLGDSPYWDPGKQTLYFVDILGKTIHKYHTITKQHVFSAVGPKQPSFILPIDGEDDQFVMSLSKELARIRWVDGGSPEILDKLVVIDMEKETFFNRFNHGKCDNFGRLWAGTMSTIAEQPLVYPPTGRLYSFGDNFKIKQHLDGIKISTGLAFNNGQSKMYHIDSLKGTIDQYDFDGIHGNICNGKAIFTLAKHQIDGIPNGMTIDADGNLWVAIFNGGRIIKIDPNRPETLLQTIKMPVRQITSLTFGGPDLDELFVTTGAYKFENQELPQPHNGALYRIAGISVKGSLVPKIKL